MIINESLDISKDTGVPVTDDILAVDVGEFPDQHEWDDEETFYPFDEFVPSVRFKVVLDAISGRHQTKERG